MECLQAVLRVLDCDFLVLEVVDVHRNELFVPDHLVVVELRDVEFLARSVVIPGVVAVVGLVPPACQWLVP